MTSTVQERLASWRMLLEHGGPSWLVEHAPRIVSELEADLAAQVDRDPQGHDPAEGHGRNDESQVGEADAPNSEGSCSHAQ